VRRGPEGGGLSARTGDVVAMWVQNPKDYYDHYLKTDVLLLADVFQHFRWTTYESHRLACLHFITLPSLPWAMALIHTEAKLDLITDSQAYLMIENSMRGGIETISKRYACANNLLLADFNPSKETKLITYFDANSLYATARCEPLPVGKFHFLSDKEVAEFDFDTIAPDAATGYIIECNLEYPDHLHDIHNDYPMAPEHLEVSGDILSQFALDLIDPRRPWVPSKKLIPNLMNKTTYVTHYRNLQLYTRHGLKFTEIHRVLAFEQAPWLKSWIELCNDGMPHRISNPILQNYRQTQRLEKPWNRFGTESTFV